MVKSFQLPLTGLTRLSSVYDTYAQRVLADKPSNYWRLNETSGLTAVDVAGGANGTISGGVTLNQPGATADGDTAMAFNGTTGQISVPNGPTFAFGTGPLTCECWVKVSVIQNGYALDFKGAGTSNPGAQFVCDAGPAWRFAIANGTVSQAMSWSFAYADGQWHHLVGVVTRGASDVVLFYGDGVLRHQVTLPATGWSLTPNRPVLIGAFSTGGGFFNGAIDEVAIYPVALTAAQILAHYQARALPFLPGSYPYAVVQDGPSNYWRLNEPSGTVATDLVGGKNGTISGGVTLNQPGALADGDTAMTFNGTTGQIVTAAPVTLPVTATIEAWVRVPVGMVGNQVIASTAAAEMLFYLSSGAVVLDRGGSLTSLLKADTNAWRHLVAVMTPTTTSLYIDGVFDRSGAETPVLLTTTFTMGRYSAGAFLNGSLDEVAIYPVALTPAQIAAHYTLGLSALALPVSAALDLPYRQLLLAPDPANPGPVTIGDASGTGVTLPAAPTTRYPYLALGPFDNGPLKLSHFYATGPGTLNILGVPY